MQPLSVAIITYNEEKNIQQCLETIKRISDEIVVIDSFSSDSTKKICLEWGVRFIEKEFMGYGLQKRFATDQARYDYVFNLDADEFLSEELISSILEEKKKNFTYDGYTMNRLNRFADQWIRHGTWYPDRKLRLFNRKKGNWTNEIVHEDLQMQPGCTLRHLKGDLMHNAYNSLSQYKAKNEKYSSLSAQSLFMNGKRTNAFNLLINPIWAFLRSYVILRGFLDGKNGFIIAKEISEATYKKYFKLSKLQRQQSANP